MKITNFFGRRDSNFNIHEEGVLLPLVKLAPENEIFLDSYLTESDKAS